VAGRGVGAEVFGQVRFANGARPQHTASVEVPEERELAAGDQCLGKFRDLGQAYVPGAVALRSSSPKPGTSVSTSTSFRTS